MYLRLSRDDGDEGESNSIGNQRELIKAMLTRLALKLPRSTLMMALLVQTLKDQILKRCLATLKRKAAKQS